MTLARAPGAPATAPQVPPTLSAPSAPDIERRVEQALLAQLFASTPQSVAGGIVFAGVVAWVVAGHVDAATAWGWAALKALIGGLRIVQVRRFHADAARGEATGRWLHRYTAGIGVDVVTWAAMVPLFLPGAPGGSTILLICGLVGIASLGVFTTTSNFRISVMFSSACLVPMALWFAIAGGVQNLGVSLGTLIYLTVITVETRKGHERLKEMLRLRFENAALAEERARALAAAQSSSEAKTRFLAMVSHEMRTPLNGILGMAQAMRGQVGPSGRSLEILENSARLLGRIIGDLLDLSRMEAGKVELQPHAMDLRHDVEEVVALLGPMAEQRGLRLHLQWDDTTPRAIVADGTRIGQVLHNLVGNALKFTERGGVTLHVRPVEGSAAKVLIEVEDTGPGIAAVDIDRIFDAFERVAGVGLVPGTGLGLSIARRLARAMGGDVTCTSALGLGSTFRFTFDAAPAGETFAPPPTGAGAGAGTPAGVGGTAPERAAPGTDRASSDVPVEDAPIVLVVDDNEINTLVACALLEQIGCRHAVANDGAQALQAMSSRRFDGVMMDCHMPVLDGWEATRRWRSLEAAPPGRPQPCPPSMPAHLPIIGVTASAAPEDRQACLDAGMDEHLPKPFDRDDLERLLRRFGVLRTSAEIRP